MCEKIVAHLLSNALKFTFGGAIRVSLRALAQHAELTVSDAGVGIAEGQQEELFRRFHRVPGAHARSHEGAGLGIALVHELVRLDNGRLRVHSRPGEGSTFTVWVPNTRPAASRETRSPRPA